MIVVCRVLLRKASSSDAAMLAALALVLLVLLNTAYFLYIIRTPEIIPEPDPHPYLI